MHHLRLHAGGLTKACLDRVSLFAHAGWDVHVALLSPDPQLADTISALRRSGRLPAPVVVHRYPGSRPGVVRAGLRRLHLRPRPSSIPSWLDRLGTREGALVFADSPTSYPHLARMRNPRNAGVYVVHVSHLSAAAAKLGSPREIANGPLTKRFAALSDVVIRAADRIVVLTEAQKRDLQLRWGDDLPVEVIPHCAYPPELPETPAHDPRLVVGLGRVDYFKRWDDAIRVMARVVRQVPDARLIVYGQGEDLERVQGVVEELGMGQHVTFPGYTEAPLQAMASAACVLSTSRREAMPLVLLEALSVGTPLVVYDIRYGPREIVRDGVDGFVLPRRDIQGAAAAVVRLLTEPDLRQRMSTAAREVCDRFSQTEHDRAWLDLAREVYDQRADGR